MSVDLPNVVTLDDLHDALASVDGKQPTQPLLPAIAYNHGVTQTGLAAYNNIGRRTIYNWVMGLHTDEPLVEAVTDDHRSGRNRKVSAQDLDEYRQTVQEPPHEVGYDEASSLMLYF